MILILLNGWGGRLEDSYLVTCEDDMKHLSHKGNDGTLFYLLWGSMAKVKT